MTVTISEAEILDIVTSRLKDKQVWTDLASAFDQMILANVDDPIAQLEVLRFLPPDADQNILADACRMMGFDLTQDILNLSVEKFSRLATQLGMYPDTNGTEAFTAFISLMINGFCDVTYLWSEDYVNFYPEPKGPTIDQGGRWFKTTHVEMAMGFESLDGLVLKKGESLYHRLLGIFNQRNPVTLVIERGSFSAYTSCEYGYAATLLTPESEITITNKS
jgi:hypothetical protein